MFDLELHLTHEPGQLARMGEVLGAAGISVEGGGMWLVGDVGVAHFLVEDGPGAAAALAEAGLTVAATRPVLTQRLDQDRPGQLGAFCRAMADAGVDIEVLYSDHDHRLIVVVDQPAAGAAVSEAWTAGRLE
ncbi:MAG: amino acid-binding ACT domain-containing protein [Actinomycetota bacterium]